MTKHRRIIGTTPDVIKVVEQRLGQPLPPSFAAWLRKHNGSRDIYPVPDEGEPRTLTGNVFAERELLRGYVEECFGRSAVLRIEQLLPIAAVGDGDHWCLDLATRDDTGEARVVRWSHETGETDEVAPSFEAFIVEMEAGELAD